MGFGVASRQASGHRGLHLVTMSRGCPAPWPRCCQDRQWKDLGLSVAGLCEAEAQRPMRTRASVCVVGFALGLFVGGQGVAVNDWNSRPLKRFKLRPCRRDQ